MRDPGCGQGPSFRFHTTQGRQAVCRKAVRGSSLQTTKGPGPEIPQPFLHPVQPHNEPSHRSRGDCFPLQYWAVKPPPSTGQASTLLVS